MSTHVRFYRSERAGKTAFLSVGLFFLLAVTVVRFWATTDTTFGDSMFARRSETMVRNSQAFSEPIPRSDLDTAREQLDFFEALLNLSRVTSREAQMGVAQGVFAGAWISEQSRAQSPGRSGEEGEIVLVTPEEGKRGSTDKLRFNSEDKGVTGHELLHTFFEQVVVPHDLSGKLNVHIWLGICGSYVEQLRYSPLFPRFPYIRKFSESLESKFEATDFGQRVFGFIHPETSGAYQFAIASDDTSELWLSTDGNPKNSRLIAAVYSASGTGWTTPNNYKKYPIQISREIILRSSRKYYVEVLHKQAKGRSHVRVLWKSPKSRTFETVGKDFVSLFVDDKEMHDEESGVQDIDFNSFAPSGLPSHMKRKLDRKVRRRLYQC